MITIMITATRMVTIMVHPGMIHTGITTTRR